MCIIGGGGEAMAFAFSMELQADFSPDKLSFCKTLHRGTAKLWPWHGRCDSTADGGSGLPERRHHRSLDGGPFW